MNSHTPCPGIPLYGCARSIAPLCSGIRPMFRRMVLLGLILSLALLGGQAKPSFAAVMRIDALQQARSLVPYLQFLPDSPAGLHIDEAASPALADAYQPLAQGIPRSFSGPVWLRLSLVKASPASSAEEDGRLLLDLGRDLPGTSRLFSVRKDTPEGEARLWQSEVSSSHVVFSLPAPGLVPATVYMRLDAPPTPWFSPTLQTASAYTPPVLPLDLLLPALLAAALLMSLLRAQREKAQWRIWSVLLTGAALLQAFFPVTALPAGPISPRMLCALLTPGFMLMLLPHLGRHLLQTPKTAPGVDAFLRMAPLLGAALVLAPLIPDLRWLSRYLALWPLLLLPLLPAAMRCLSRHIPGALAFFTACLAPVLGLAASFLELLNATPSLLGAGGHIWGMTLGCLALALASPGKDASAEEENPDTVWSELPGLILHEGECQEQDFETLADQAEKQRVQDAPFADRQVAGSPHAASRTPENRQSNHPAPLPEAFFTPETFASSVSAAPLQALDMETRLNETETPRQPDTADDASPSLALLSDLGQEQEEPCANPEDQDTPQDSFAKLGSTAERYPLAPCSLPDELHQAPPVPPQESQPEDPEQSMPWSLEPLQTPKRAAPLHVQLPSLESFAPANELAPLTETSGTGVEEHFFDLPRLLKETHAAVADMAEQKGLGLSWHVSPNIDQYYDGEGELLGETLTLLLRDAVRTATHGKIELTVRGLPGNANPGHLVFALSVRNGGTAMRPGDITAIGRAWALADRCGGFFSLDHTQDGDMSVVFSVQFAVPGPEAELDAGRDITAALEDPAPLAEPLVVEHIPAFEETMHPLPPTSAASSLGNAGEENADPIPAPEPEQAAELSPWMQDRIILVDMAAGSRRLRAQYLSSLPHTLLEADSIAAALDIYTRNPSGLMIFDADMPEADIVAGIAKLRDLERTLSFPRTATLSLTAHDLQSERMLAAGSDEALVKPFSREQLQESVLRLVPSAAAVPQQAPSTPEELVQAQLAPPTPDDVSAGVLADAELVALGLSAADIVPEQIHTPQASPAEETEARKKTPLKAPDAESEATQAPETAPEDAAPPPAPEQAQPLEASRQPDEPLEEGHGAQTASVRELPLLDLIITDIDPAEQEDVETPPAETAPFEETRQSAPLEHPVQADREKAAIAAPEVLPPQAAVEQQPAPAGKIVPRATVRISLREQVQSKVVLSGVNDGVNADMLPFVPGLIYELGDAVTDALRGQEEKSCLMVQGAVERLAGKAAAFGLEGLERVARCVERAAAADDSDAVGDLLNELVALTERYKEALRLCHRNSL